jgi:hypothetical protein
MAVLKAEAEETEVQALLTHGGVPLKRNHQVQKLLPDGDSQQSTKDSAIAGPVASRTRTYPASHTPGGCGKVSAASRQHVEISHIGS